MFKDLAFRYTEPTFFAGLLDDPVLYLKVRPMGRALLIDCGQIHHLAKRVIKSIDAIFISHAHMDHFMGLDTFTRNVHVAPRTIELFGPSGLARKLEHKLAGDDWNLTEEYWCSFFVQEVCDKTIRRYLLPGPEGFPCRFDFETQRADKEIYRNPWLRLSAAVCDHKIPTLIFRVDERPSFGIDQSRLASEGLVRGAWIRELNRQFYQGRLGEEALTVLRQENGTVTEQTLKDSAALYERIGHRAAPASIGYLTDVGFEAHNIDTICSFLADVDLLVTECTFLESDLYKARKSHHLCTRDLNELLRCLRPRTVLPMHLSKSYIGRTEQLYDELDLPSGVRLIRLPERIAPKPLLPSDVTEKMTEEVQKRP